MQGTEQRIYWANSFFTEADRMFNKYCAIKLRHAGYDVFLPQEAKVNLRAEPPAEDIFRLDTTEILNSDLVIACLDQETIDSGVACEIGVAYTYDVPVLGLYTDIRQSRAGRGRMYKNLYVVGAIEAIGKIVKSVEELLQEIPEQLAGSCRIPSSYVVRHFDQVASNYSNFVNRLESWYNPRWTVKSVVEKLLGSERATRMLEIGCGTGELGNYLCTRNLDLSYLGYDISEKMTEVAQTRYGTQRCMYTSRQEIVLDLTRNGAFDLGMTSFTLHDQQDKECTLKLLASCVRPGGCILIVDLSTQDLPRLVKALRYDLGRPAMCNDSRLEPEWVTSTARQFDLDLLQCELALPTVTFPSADDLDRYMELFGIYHGMDLPLGLRPSEHTMNREQVRKILSRLEFPFEDQRVFIICTMRKRGSTRAS